MFDHYIAALNEKYLQNSLDIPQLPELSPDGRLNTSLVVPARRAVC